ncbi:MAG TPA: hypothetical protein VFN97_07730 [Actinospica sp.]|nr:hypothetical protein [Actinospica sp.]
MSISASGSQACGAIQLTVIRSQMFSVRHLPAADGRAERRRAGRDDRDEDGSPISPELRHGLGTTVTTVESGT